MTSGSLQNYYGDGVNDDENENNGVGDYSINNNKARTSKSFEYKTKIIGNTPADNNTLDTEVVVPLKFFSNFWTFLDLPLINCEVELDLPWSKYYIISELLRTTAMANNPGANPPVLQVAATKSNGNNFSNNSF